MRKSVLNEGMVKRSIQLALYYPAAGKRLKTRHHLPPQNGQIEISTPDTFNISSLALSLTFGLTGVRVSLKHFSSLVFRFRLLKKP